MNKTSGLLQKPIDFEFLEATLKFKPNLSGEVANKRHNLHGKVMIDKMGGEDSIPQFIKMWREYFLETMNPQFLPNSWSVDHCITRVFGAKSKFFYDEEQI